jgi:hypothetical protein
MDVEQFPGAIMLALICVLAATGLWFLSIRLRSLKMKQFAVMIGAIPVLIIGLNLASSWFGGDNPDYRSTAVGPSSREPNATDKLTIPVTNATARHQLELRPKIRGGNPPSQPVHLRFEVRSPKDEILAHGEQDLAPGQGLRWSSLRAEFQPHEEGDHVLVLDIPQPVSSVDIIVRELRK